MSRGRKSQRPVVETLEPRILYSADFAPGLLDAAPLASEAEQRTLDANGEFSHAEAAELHTRHHEVVFVDCATPDYGRLIKDIRSQGGDRDVEVVLLDGDRDGIEQIGETLARRHDVAAIHIVSHGTQGSVQLGSGRLDFDSLLKNATRIKDWGSALTADADLLIYGCDVAATQGGKSLIDALARLTGADVAGSDDLTGAEQRGGDWDLEFHIGSVDTPIVFSQSVVLDWNATLQSVAVGGETRVNTTTIGTQETWGDPRTVAMDASGGNVVVWNGNGTGDANGVFAQRFNANGVAQGTEIAVNAVDPDAQYQATVAMDASGNFVVAWVSDDTDGSLANIYARRFNAAGMAQGGEFRVNTTTANRQDNVGVAMDANGDFVVGWSSDSQDGDGMGVYARRYNASGVAQDVTEFRVNASTAGNQYLDSITMDSAGNFIVGWASSDGDGFGAYIRRYNAAGNALGGELRVNQTTVGIQSVVSVAHDAGGNFVATWRSTGQDGDSGGIYARRYDSSGTALGGEFLVNSVTTGNQDSPTIGMDSDGDFVVVWRSQGQDADGWGVYMREYYANGSANGAAVRVNTTTTGDQNYPNVAMNGHGNFVVAWTGNGTQLGQADTNAGGIFTQRYANVEALDDAYSVNEDGILTVPAASAWWNTSWSQRKQLTFNNTAQAENLTNFAVLVKLDNTRINYALTQNAGQDLRFVDTNGTLLAHEIETWNESGTSYVWVSVPQIDASSGSDCIWMYYGNAAAPDAQNAAAVWDAGFSGVWHLNTDELDSAGTNDGINSNSTNGAGVIASGQSFNGSNAQVYTTTQFSDPQQYTIEAWFRTSSAGGKEIIGFENNQTGTASANWDRHLYVGTDGRLYFGSYYEPTDSEDVANSTTNYADGVWHYAVGVRNNGTDTLSLYVDGVLVDTSPNASSENYNGYWRLGGYKTNGWPNGADGYFNGSIDEARVSTQVRSAAWVKAQYLSMTDAFVGFSAAQGVGVLGNDTDPNGDALSAVLVGGPSNAASFTLNANGSFTYIPTANFSGTDSFTYRANDGTDSSNLATVTITVNPVNDAPVNTLPGAQVTSEDTTLVLSSGNGNRISITDVDAGSGAMQVTLSATNGRLTLAGVGGLSFSSGDGMADATMTFTGTVANINTALNGLAFAPTANFTGAASVAIATSDQGNTGSGGTLTDSDTVNVTVSAVNDAPTATITPASYAATEQMTLTLHGTGLSIADPDAGAGIMTATVSVTAGTLSASAGSTGVSVAGSGTATLTLIGTVTRINNLLAGVSSGTLTYLSSSDAPAASATLTLSVNDGGNTGSGGARTGSDTATINISAVNDAPTATITATSYNASEQTTLILHGTGMSLADPDAGSSSISATVSVTAGTLTAGAGTNGVIVSGSGTSTVTLTGARTEINNLLSGTNGGTLTYINASDAPAASATLTLLVNDGSNTGSGGTLTSSDTAVINISAVNDAPVNSVPGAQSTNEDTARVFSSANGNLISIADADAAASTIQVTLTATNGTVALAGTAGLTITAGADGSATVTFTGTVASINTALNGLAYTPAAHFNGAASLQIVTSDLGNTGSGGALIDADTVSITVNAVDDAIGAVNDANAAANSVAENAAVGTLVGITAVATDLDTTDTVTYSLDVSAGGRFAINSTTGVVTVAGALDREAAASHSITVRATSSGGGFSTQAFTVSLTDVDEFDVGVISDANPAANSVAENAAVGTLVGIAASAADADATTNAITYTLDNDAGGRFAINASSGVVTVAGALDRESAASHGIVVRATSTDGSFSTQGFTVALSDVDEFDVGAISDTNAAANSVAENAAVGTLVGITASAGDADATTNAITYSLDNDAGGRFAINASSGVVSVAGALDRESVASHGIVVRATSADLSFSTQAFSIALSDVDEFDVGAISDANAAANSVAENAGIGSVVGITAFASDADATGNAITYSLDDDAGGRFAINASTGLMTVAGALDYETATSHSVVVRATSADGSTTAQSFTIAVTDVNDSGVGAIGDANAAADSVAENAVAGTVVGITAQASDPGDTVGYSLDNNASGRFAINASSGVVTVAGALDREAAASHSIVVRATSTDGSFNTQSFTISLSDVDEFDVSAISDANPAANSVAENAAVGTLVGITASAGDADATTNAITYSLDNDAGGRFAINASSGVVTVAGALDRESAASYGIVVHATSADGSFSAQVFTIDVTDVDEFDVGAISDSDPAANSVAENAAVGALVGITASASDADATNNAITYSLDDSAGGRFAVNSASGVVTVASALDAEAAASHNIAVRATSADGSASTQVFTIAVGDVDEFDVGVISDANPAANSVAENAAVGTLVGIAASAADADATTNAITYTLDNDAGGRFAINASSGVVTVAGALDRESAASHGIVVRATSTDGSFSTQGFTVALSDVDEFDVGAISDTNAAANSVAENAAVGTLVGITASAGDADATTNAITYSLDNDAGGRFAINASSGVVSVAGALDRESVASHGIVVRATSADLSFSTQAFSIALSDVDEFDVGAISDANAAANSVAENAGIGSVVGITAFASDADATGNAITYSLDDDAGGRFAIDAASGVVTVAGALDVESSISHTITVHAASADGSFSTQVFAIGVGDMDEFDTGAVSDTDGAVDSVAENAAAGTAVGITALAVDADATNNVMTYSLDDSAGGRFAIDSSTGVVTVAGALNREAAASHDITIRATSADGSFSAQVFTIDVTDVDEFDVGAISDSDPAANSVAENAAVGALVGITASASDADATNNAITYSLDDSAGGRFAVNSASGVVTVASALDAEAAASHNIAVRATSADGSASTQVFTIAVGDVDEFDVGVISDANAAANSVAENAAVGTLVGITASAGDADATTNVITYSLDNDAGGRFAINASSGVVTVAGALDRESAASHAIVMRATSTDGSFSTQGFTVAVSDVDEFGVGPIVDGDAAANSVAENAVPGTIVGITAAASDADATTNSITYSLDVDAGGCFVIDASSGVVRVAGALDAEAAASHNITVRATSADGSLSTQTLTVAVANVNEAPVIDNQAFSGAENSANATVFGTLTFSDPDFADTATYAIIAGNLGGAFSIDASGQLVVANGAALDFESTPSFALTVEVQDAAGLTDTATVTVNLSAVNETPALVSNTLTLVQGGSVVISPADIAASDVDTPAAALVFTASNVVNGHFELISTPGLAIMAFTQADIDAGQVRFVHDGSAAAPAFEVSVSDGMFNIGPFDGVVSFAIPVLPATILPPLTPPVAPAPNPAPAAPTPIAVGDVGSDATGDGAEVTVSTSFSPGGGMAAFKDLQDNSVELPALHRVKALKALQPVANFNHFQLGPSIDPAFELLRMAPAQLQFTPSVPMDWVVASAFPDHPEEDGRDRVQVLLDSVQFGGMALSVGVVWWASRISGLLGSLMASAPAWRHIDPLPVLGRDEEDEEKWYDPEDRDADANELAVSLVLEGGGHAARSEG